MIYDRYNLLIIDYDNRMYNCRLIIDKFIVIAYQDEALVTVNTFI